MYMHLLTASHHRNFTIARCNEEAAQVSVFHVGQDDERNGQRRVLLSL